jgi:hypothetical protein
MLSHYENLAKEKNLVETLIHTKYIHKEEKHRQANAFFGSDPLSKTESELRQQLFRNLTMDIRDSKYDLWATSVNAGYSVKIHSEAINILNSKVHLLYQQLAQESARLNAAAEARRRADEQARIAAEAEARRRADEQARIVAEAEARRRADEQARIAAEAEARRRADEQARIAAEADARRRADEQARIAEEADARRRADEQARIAEEAEARRRADEQARIVAKAEARRRADEQAQLATAAEAARIAQEQARQRTQTALTQAQTFHTRTPISAATTMVLTPTGVVAVLEAAGVTLQAAIRAAVATVGGAAASVASGFAVGAGALLYSPKLGNGELPLSYIVNTPLSDLAPEIANALSTGATTASTVEMPVRLGAITGADGQSQVAVIATKEVSMPTTVQVVIATYDASANRYTATTTDAIPNTLTWTPIVAPGNASTQTPAQAQPVPAYTGATVTPVLGRLDSFPATQIHIHDLITVFPADSGLAPIYTVFSSPYKGATTKGEHSGRYYNPEKAGGPTLNLDWTTVTITREGVDLVKLHTGRFQFSAGNGVMIERLERIIRGETNVTDVDKRFYTHEIRELERYRALGIQDGAVQQDQESRAATWNNTHTATLEDYKMHDNHDLLYTQEAITADDKQEYGEYFSD